MGLGAILGLALIYIVLVWVFASYTWPLAIMTAIPLGITGAVAGHWLMGMHISASVDAGSVYFDRCGGQRLHRVDQLLQREACRGAAGTAGAYRSFVRETESNRVDFSDHHSGSHATDL